MNINLLGEVFSGECSDEVLYLVDPSNSQHVYSRGSRLLSVDCFPVFKDSEEMQMIYSTYNSRSFKTLREIVKSRFGTDTIDYSAYSEMFRKRYNKIDKCIFEESFMLDFKYGSSRGLIKKFPSHKTNEKANQILEGRVLDKDIIITQDSVKVIMDVAYKGNHEKLIIKRTPERTINLDRTSVQESKTCKTILKFKTTNIKEILEICREISAVENYYEEDLFKEDLEQKINGAMMLIETGNYKDANLCYRLISVLSLAVYRFDITTKIRGGRDLIFNIVLENEKYFQGFIAMANTYLNLDTLKFLKSIYARSDYRMSY